ncbi:MAG: hypothetical protein WAN74_00030 [Thermoplasmata archaeon]
MTQTCPECGTPVEYVERAAQVLTGSCTDCGHAFTILQGSSADAPNLPPRGARVALRPDTEEGSEVGGDRPKCEDCGSTLSFRASPSGGVEGICPGCQSKFGYTPAGAEMESAPRMRPPRGRPSPGRDSDFEAPRTRPCRECGGPLRFSTNPDGTVAGECGSCGNKFTLPPRRDDEGGRGERGGGRPFNRNFAPRSGGRGGGRYSPGGGRGGPRRFDSPRGPPRGRDGDRGDDRDDYRKRRRPARD